MPNAFAYAEPILDEIATPSLDYYRAQGDLSENAEYEAAKDKQGFIEGRILEIEGKLAAAQVIDPSTVDAGGRVVFGSTVDLEDEDSGAKVTYQIVGEDEADLKQGLISISSPIARALIGKESGDVAEVQAPSPAITSSNGAGPASLPPRLSGSSAINWCWPMVTAC